MIESRIPNIALVGPSIKSVTAARLDPFLLSLGGREMSTFTLSSDSCLVFITRVMCIDPSMPPSALDSLR